MSSQINSERAQELTNFLRANSARLRMNVPTLGAVQETIDSLAKDDPNRGDQISAEDFAKLLVRRYPELHFEWNEGEESAENPDEPATERQIAYLKVLGAPVPTILSVREASDLIDKWKNRMSHAQKRRLDFYGLKYDANITREQANMLIDRYKEANPESEAAYQAWKAEKGIH